jgi:hypothetical protein
MLFACPASQWRELSLNFHWTERELAGLDKGHSSASPCRLENALINPEDLRKTQSSP